MTVHPPSSHQHTHTLPFAAIDAERSNRVFANHTAVSQVVCLLRAPDIHIPPHQRLGRPSPARVNPRVQAKIPRLMIVVMLMNQASWVSPIQSK